MKAHNNLPGTRIETLVSHVGAFTERRQVIVYKIKQKQKFLH